MTDYLKDLVERVVTTGAFTFLSVFTLSDLGSVKVAAVAAGAACLSLIKGALAARIGDGSAGIK